MTLNNVAGKIRKGNMRVVLNRMLDLSYVL